MARALRWARRGFGSRFRQRGTSPVADLWDTSLSALWFALLFWATLALRGERSTARWVGYGVLWAVGALINTSLISVLPFFLAWLAWEAHKERMPWLRPIAISVLVITLGVVPWVIRSYLVVGKAFPVRSTFGLMLWFGNNGRGICGEFVFHLAVS